MGNLVFQATLGGQVNLVGPNTASTFNLNVPAVSATLATTDANTFTAAQTFTAGSAAAPAITTSGDTNTGIFFPAADTVGISTGGTERARVDSSGNLGLGVTPSAWYAPTNYRAVQVGQSSFVGRITSGAEYTQILSNAFIDSAGASKYINNGTATLYEMLNGSFRWSNAGSGTAGNAITFTQAMTLDASGNLLVGGTSATYSASGRGLVEVNGSSNSLLALKTGGSAAGYVYHDGTALSLVNTKASYIQFTTNSIDAARIDSSGRLLVGTTSGTQGHRFDWSGANQWATQIFNANSSTPYGLQIAYTAAAPNGANYPFLSCADTSQTRLAIYANGTVNNWTGSYAAFSDIKLKENIVDATPKLEKLMQVRIRNFNMKGNDLKMLGVIAQELEPIFPNLIDESADYETVTTTDEDGKEHTEQVPTGTTTKSVKYSIFVPMLIKAIQEQQAIIETLTARITALEQ